jgi:transcriptional regulator GlxA family with amidase domain
MKGRHIDALRVYHQYAARASTRLRADLSKLPYCHELEKEEIAEGTDSIQLQLPLRYRKAYHYIIENLNDPKLSVKQVAAHINVTERALQMAFRTHIGMTPAELLRRRRVECIRDELHKSPQHIGVLEVASRWGMSVRSTLAQNYRAYFDEVPTRARTAGVNDHTVLA